MCISVPLQIVAALVAPIPAAAYTQFPVEPEVRLSDPIAQGEVEEALQKLHNGRAKGADGMPAEHMWYAKGKYKKGEPMPQPLLATLLTTLLNSAFRQGAIPASFNSSLITPVFKKGDFFNTASHRPIAVAAPFMRLYAVILNARLMAFAEEHGLRAESYTGFRPELATVHQLFALQHFITEAPLYACFLDLKGAYDRVQRPMLWQALQSLEIHGTMLTALHSLYRDSTVRMNISGRMGAAQSSKTGLKQGCPLNPTLFGLFADSECKGISKPPVLRKALMCVGMIKCLLSGMLMILCCWLVLHKASAAH